ncbi:MAG: hypothetical protein LLG04_18870 [Parachlamydia sp.]|jgi:hypothetical protein|nr:hypothetical protein [Parachlamydia sp.]
MIKDEDIKFIEDSAREIYDSLHEKYRSYEPTLYLPIFSSLSMIILYNIYREVPPGVAEKLKATWIQAIQNFDLDESEVK